MSDPIDTLKALKQQARDWIAGADDATEAIRRVGHLYTAAKEFRRFAHELRALTVSVVRETRKHEMAQKDMAAELGVGEQRISQLKAEGDKLATKEDR